MVRVSNQAQVSSTLLSDASIIITYTPDQYTMDCIRPTIPLNQTAIALAQINALYMQLMADTTCQRVVDILKYAALPGALPGTQQQQHNIPGSCIVYLAGFL